MGPSVNRLPSINLARRPFRNNTVHYVVFASCFTLLAAASVYNVYDYVQTGGEISRLTADLGDRTSRYRGLGDEVEQMKADVSKLDLTTLNTKSNFANGLILSRLFSWSALFDRIEELIPADVKIRSIRPAISPKGIEIQLDGMARTPQALYEFETALDGSNFFTGVYPVSESTRESKTELNFDLMMNYIPAGRVPVAPAAPATPTAGLPQPVPTSAGATEGQPAVDANARPVATEAATAMPGAPAAVSTGPAAGPEQAAPQEAADAGGSAKTTVQEAAPVVSAPNPVPSKPAPEMTNKEFVESFGKERFMRARGKFGVRPPVEHPELNNADFIQKFGMEVFLQSRGHLDRAAQVTPPPVGAPNQEAPK